MTKNPCICVVLISSPRALTYPYQICLLFVFSATALPRHRGKKGTPTSIDGGKKLIPCLSVYSYAYVYSPLLPFSLSLSIRSHLTGVLVFSRLV